MSGTDKVNLVALFEKGEPIRTNKNLFQVYNLLKWRQKFQRSEYYELELCSGAVLKVNQILNGEIKGLGTGSQVWPAAHVLVKFLELRYGMHTLSGLHRLKLCDIGTGTGITGFAAASLGAEVTLTDQQHLLPFIEENKALAMSAGIAGVENVRVARYDWGENAAELVADCGPFDLVLVSDCVLPKIYPIDILVKVIIALCCCCSCFLPSYRIVRFRPLLGNSRTLLNCCRCVGCLPV